ncbi:hypothetical protein DITRI_Ditri20bG0131700 [Diplodiscus trichospermus]
MFLVSWAKMARSNSISVVPSFRRSLLNPRHPGGCIDPSLDQMYMPISSFPPPKQHHQTTDHLVNRIYYITAEQLDNLQSLASSNGYRRTKLESFSAFLWKMIALLAAKDNFETTKMGIVVDGRARLGEGDKDKASLMSSYFGNILSIPFGVQRVNELIEQRLSWVANQVHHFLDQAVTKEHFLGLVDWVEAHRPEPTRAKVYSNGSDAGPAFVVSSGQRFPVSKVDFGWGCPVFGSYYCPWGGDARYVMPMPSPTREGDWVVYMHLFKRQLELIETEAINVFRPLTFDYLNSSAVNYN